MFNGRSASDLHGPYRVEATLFGVNSMTGSLRLILAIAALCAIPATLMWLTIG